MGYQLTTNDRWQSLEDLGSHSSHGTSASQQAGMLESNMGKAWWMWEGLVFLVNNADVWYGLVW